MLFFEDQLIFEKINSNSCASFHNSLIYSWTSGLLFASSLNQCLVSLISKAQWQGEALPQRPNQKLWVGNLFVYQ